MKQTTTLPLLVLPYPRVLFPTARLTLPVDRPTALAVQALLQQNSDGRPHVLAVPALATAGSADIQIAEMGVVARVVRVVKTPTVRENDYVHFVLLHGGGVRARFTDPLSSSPGSALSHVNATPVNDDTPPSADSIEPFRSAALVMLSRLATDSAQSSRSESWRKVRDVIEEMSVSNAVHLADLLLSGLEAEHADKLGWFHLMLLCRPSYVSL
jgi:ATP-dependent Lon protease